MKKYKVTITLSSRWLDDILIDSKQLLEIHNNFIKAVNGYISELQDNIEALNDDDRDINYKSFTINDNNYNDYIVVKLESDLSNKEIYNKLTDILSFYLSYTTSYTYYTLYLLTQCDLSSDEHSYCIGHFEWITEEE